MSETYKLEYFGDSQMQRRLYFHENILLGYMNLIENQKGTCKKQNSCFNYRILLNDLFKPK